MGLETVAVVGSGLMGRGIAYVAALGGYRTIVHDVSGEALERALRQIGKDLDEGVARGKVEAGEAERARARLTSSTSLDEAARAADFVIEAIPEDLVLKLRVFARLDELCRPEVVLAQRLGEKYRPAPLLVEHVKAGRLGRKVGRGVYDYPSGE